MKGLNFIELEVIQPSLKDLLGHLKINFFKRVENDEKKGTNNIQWIDYITEILLTYSNKDVHSATGPTPNEARKERNEFKAKLNVSVKAKKERIYPSLEVGDRVNLSGTLFSWALCRRFHGAIRFVGHHPCNEWRWKQHCWSQAWATWHGNLGLHASKRLN